MAVRLSIVTNGGIEIYSFTSKNLHKRLVDPQLLSGFLTAIQLYSESMGDPIKNISFNNLTLYLKNYGDFAFRIIMDEKLSDDQVDVIFTEMLRVIYPIISNHTPDKVLDEKRLSSLIKPILMPFIDELDYDKDSIEEKLPSTTRIGIVGLSNSGKTSIKNKFFESWSESQIKNIKPTIGVDISTQFQEFLNHRLLIRDFGGQENYRYQYLKQADLWAQISTLIFVVDIQDPSSYKEANKYLSEILKVLKESSTHLPKISIFLHKYDIKLRENLTQHIKEFFINFRDLIDNSTLYLTTVEDLSSNIALIKTLYFTLPEVLIRRLFEEEFIDYFEAKILKRYSKYYYNFEQSDPAVTREISRTSRVHGMSLGYILQNSWLDAIRGNWMPKERKFSSKSILLTKTYNSIVITIPNWSDEDISIELTNLLLYNILIGILKTFELPPPIKVSENEFSATWEILFQ